MEKQDIIELKINDITEDGQAVGKTEDGIAVFVQKGRGTVMPLPGDTVSVEINKVKKRFAKGVMVDLIQESEYRMPEFCDHDKDCGGCPAARLDYDMQCSLKHKRVKDALERIGGLDSPTVRDLIKAEDTDRYRNKAVLSVSKDESGEVCIGFHRGRSHSTVDCQDCNLQTPAVAAVADTIRRFMDEFRLIPYDYKEKKGFFRNVIVRTAASTGKVMVIIITGGKKLPHIEELVKMLDEAVTGLVAQDGYNRDFIDSDIDNDEDLENCGVYTLSSVYVDYNNGKRDKLSGGKPEHIAGETMLSDKIGDCSFEFAPYAFSQVNPVMTEKLYNTAMDYAAPEKGDTVLDLYCGAGTIGLSMSSRMNGGISVIGIESEKSAVLNANRNAVLNGIMDARYACAKAERLLPLLQSSELTDEEKEALFKKAPGLTGVALPVKADCAIMDPPRSGCDEKLLDAVVSAEPYRIVYLSCNPATLARDIKHLVESGYIFVETTPVDMFPGTARVESVSLLVKK